MEKLADLPFIRLPVDKAGALAPPFTLPGGITDLIVISHGWKNSEADALDLYATLLRHVQQAAGAAFTRDGRRWAVAGLFWPAFRYQEDMTLLATDGTAGAVVAAAVDAAEQDLSRDELGAYAASTAAALGLDEAEFARSAIAAAAGGAEASAFVSTLRDHLTTAQDLKADHADLLEQQSGAELVNALRNGIPGTLSFARPEPDPAAGNAAGYKEVVATVQQWRRGGRAAVAWVLNQGTYYEMKARAGAVGAALAPKVEQAVAQAGGQAGQGGVRLHLIGHSFGARLVTALANGLDALRPASMSLLQGAFSHNAFGAASNRRKGGAGVDGAFRKVVAGGRVTGPLLVTHTRNDTAVGLAYPTASTLSQEVAAGVTELANDLIGGPGDRHGGIGANGALSLLDGEWRDHLAIVGSPTPVLVPGRVNNVLSDAIVRCHNDVKNAEVARLVWAAIA